MNKKLTLIKEISLLVLSFVIPFVLVIILFNANNIALGGYKNQTIMMIDMQSEYICYMRDLRNILLNHESLIYTTEKVFGGDYLSIFTFYLASPFNLFVIFFEEQAIPLFFVWSSIIKMAFASLNFYLFARFTNKFTYTKIIFAIGYGLISYSFIYISNFMWLDGVMILPLVALGLHFIKDKKHYWLYPLAIAYSLMTSWYIGFMICIFATIYFLYLFIVNFDKENRDWLRFLLRFAVFSLLGGLLSITYWLVAFIHLSGTKGFSEIPTFKFFNISMLISGLLENNYVEAGVIRQYRDYISMFTGVVSLVFAITFFFNKQYSLKERLSLLGVLTFYFLISTNTVTTALLHGGKEPTWFPARYSFIIGFIICALATKGLDEADKLFPAYYAVPLVLGVVAILIVKFTKHSDLIDRYPLSVPSIVMYFVTVLFAFLISLYCHLPLKNKTLLKIKDFAPYSLCLLLAVQIISSYRGGDRVLSQNTKADQWQTYEEYLADDAYASSFNAIKKYDKEKFDSPFYRMEATFNRPGNYNQINNNPMFYSYSGLSNFSSSSKKNVESYMGQLGFHYNGFFSKYEAGSTYSINSLLGVKYILENKTADKNYHPYFLDCYTYDKLDIEDNNNVDFYFNKKAVQMGFLSEKSKSPNITSSVTNEEGHIHYFNHFEYQNEMFKTFDGSVGEDIFKPLTINSLETSLEYTTDDFGESTFVNVKEGDFINIKFTTPIEGYGMPLYFAEKNYIQNVSFILDNKTLPVNTYWNKGIFSFKETGDYNHTLKIRFKQAFDTLTLVPELYYENIDIADMYLANMKHNEFIIDSVTNSPTKKAYHGYISFADNKKELIFTLPHEQGIRVYIDGKRVKTMTRCDIFTAVDLSKFKIGEHKITIQYQDEALGWSLPLFIIGFSSIVPLCYFYNKVEDYIFRKRKEDK